MTDYQSPYQLTAEQQLADLQKHVQDHQARGELKFQKDVADFKKNGSERFGDATFSKACDTFDAKLGNMLAGWRNICSKWTTLLTFCFT